MKSLVLAFMIVAPSIAAAQTKFVPFTTDEQTYKDVLTYLNKQPYEIAAPLVNWLMQSEAKAVADAAKAASEAKPEQK